ncbi:hypothetical protein KC363_g8882 [Hortaea werneckii]|nr:hypothetical protein KC363_g8882 [Hortaea werneckii]
MVLPSHLCEEVTKIEVSYCGWYSKWICTKFNHLPKEILHSMQNVPLVFEEVAVGAKKQQSLDAITQSLLDRQLIVSNGDVDRKCMARMAAFIFLGWQSMLYEADTKPSDGAIAIADILDGYRSSSFFRLCPSCPQTGRSLAELLLSFGLMLPKADICTSEETEDLEAFENVKVVTPGGLNAAALSSLGHYNFKFVDTIAPHLELDKATNTIFLYRWPSFCLANTCASRDNEPDSILHRHNHKGSGLAQEK